MASHDLLNSGLGTVAISKETNDNIGVPSKDFTTDTAFYIEQDYENPLTPEETFEKQVKVSTRGTQVAHQKDVIRGREMV